MKPLKEFDISYDDIVANRVNEADTELKTKIDAIEQAEKDQMRDAVKPVVEEYAIFKGVDCYVFDRVVNLSDNETKLKREEKAKIDQLHNDLEAIKTMQYSSEIKYEYDSGKALATAIAIVNDRHAKIEQMEAEKARQQEVRQTLVEPVREVQQEALKPPTVKLRASL